MWVLTKGLEIARRGFKMKKRVVTKAKYNCSQSQRRIYKNLNTSEICFYGNIPVLSIILKIQPTPTPVDNLKIIFFFGKANLHPFM